LGIKVPMDSRTFKERLQGSNPIGLRSILYLWKVLDEGYNFALNFISIGGLHTKLRAPKVAKVPNVRISGFPLGSLGTK
jgi:hypothetical protein